MYQMYQLGEVLLPLCMNMGNLLEQIILCMIEDHNFALGMTKSDLMRRTDAPQHSGYC